MGCENLAPGASYGIKKSVVDIIWEVGG